MTTVNKIEHTGATSLGEALKTNTTLTELDLSCVNKKNTEMRSTMNESPLSKCHSQATALEMLGSKHYAKHWRTTQYSCNSVLLACSLDDLVKRLSPLTFQFLANNVGNAGSTSLCELLNVNTTLKTITMYGEFNRQGFRNTLDLIDFINVQTTHRKQDWRSRNGVTQWSIKDDNHSIWPLRDIKLVSFLSHFTRTPTPFHPRPHHGSLFFSIHPSSFPRSFWASCLFLQTPNARLLPKCECFFVISSNHFGRWMAAKKITTPGVPRLSPTLVLTRPEEA